MKNEHKNYIYKILLFKYLVLFFQISLLIFVILLWQFLVDKNYVNSFITSSPIMIVKTIIELYENNNLFIHIIVTIKETIVAFIITSTLSLIIGIILYCSKFLSKVIEPFLTILNSLPKVALGPIIIIWFGANTKSIIVMSVLISLIVSILNIKNAFESTDKLKIKLMNTFAANKFQIIKYLVIPSNRQNIINTLKINISMCLIGVVSGEFLTSKAGIGYLILYGSQIFNLNLVISGIFILLIVSYIMYLIISHIKKY
ncbi:MAG: ABC transporter permease [Bacilli bacterium]|nr:ABC transporter permease [Bacilli bacterium]